MPTNVQKYRHGYVMPVTAAEYDALQRTYGEDSYVSTYKLSRLLRQQRAMIRACLQRTVQRLFSPRLTQLRLLLKL